MSDRRMSGWFVLSGIFVLMVFGLFFTFTERKTWPEHRIELGPMDMRVIPSVSTLWCEAVALHSEHSFVAYQVNHATRINPKRLNLQEVNMQVKLGGSWITNSMKLKYFLLPSSLIDIVACSSSPGVQLMIFKGNADVRRCLQTLVPEQDSDSDDYDSDADSSEEINSDSSNHLLMSADTISKYKTECSSLLSYYSVDVSYMDNFPMECNADTELHPIKMNVSSTDYYSIVIWNTNRQITNLVNLQILLDRTRYTIQRSGEPFDMCSLSQTCVIGLGFATSDRVLVSIPEEPNAGRSSFVIRSRCKPRLAVFAVLSVLLPLLLFLVVAFVVRTDKIYIRLCCTKQSVNRSLPNGHRIAAPLLDDQNIANFDVVPQERTDTDSVQSDELPPPYYTLYDSPPPYTCVKYGERKNSNTN